MSSRNNFWEKTELAARVGADDASGRQDDDDDGRDDDDGHAREAAPRPEVGEELSHPVVAGDDVGFGIGRRAAAAAAVCPRLLCPVVPLVLLLRRRVSVDVVLLEDRRKTKMAPNLKRTLTQNFKLQQKNGTMTSEKFNGL